MRGCLLTYLLGSPRGAETGAPKRTYVFRVAHPGARHELCVSNVNVTDDGGNFGGIQMSGVANCSATMPTTIDRELRKHLGHVESVHAFKMGIEGREHLRQRRRRRL